MPLLQVRDRFQVTLPAKIRKALRIKVGDVIEAVLQNDALVLKPKRVVRKPRSKAAREWEKQLIQSHLEHPIEMSEEEVLQAVEEDREELFQKQYGKGN